MATGAGDLFGNPNLKTAWGSNPGSGGATGGSNQWMSYPALPNFNPGGQGNSVQQQYTLADPLVGGKHKLGGGMTAEPTMDPLFTNNFYGMLRSMMSGGGGDLQNQLLSFLGGHGSNIPGSSQLTSMANTGNPISALPEWQKMVEAQQRGIGQGAANLKEQFAFMGDLASSPMGSAMGDYYAQTAKDQNALLGQMDTQSMEAAMQRMLSADTSIAGMAGAETQFLDSLFQGSALASPNIYGGSKGSSLLGGIGSLISAGAGGAAAGLGASAGGAGVGASVLAGLAAI
jgi:hypothetical protein